MKGYPSYTPAQQKFLENAGWIFHNEQSLVDDNGNFEVLIPLSMIFGVA